MPILSYHVSRNIELTPLLYSTNIPLLSAFCNTFHSCTTSKDRQISRHLDPEYHSHFSHHRRLRKFHPAFLNFTLRSGSNQNPATFLSTFLNSFLLKADKKEKKLRTPRKTSHQMKSCQCLFCAVVPCFFGVFLFFKNIHFIPLNYTDFRFINFPCTDII